ncbi:MAG: hypothetical protein QOG85_1069 [Gaiellaceae bacterium]|nr:hypothetical protein [Gaiellaceae bacterium]
MTASQPESLEELQAAAAKSGRQRAAAVDFSRRALGGEPVPALLFVVATVVAEALQTDFVKVLEVAPGGSGLRLMSAYGFDPGLIGTLLGGEESQSGYTLQVGQPVVVEDLETETRFVPSRLLAEHEVVSGVSVPVRGYDRPWGVLSAFSRERRTFEPGEVEFLETIASLLSAAIGRAYADDELARRVAELEAFTYSVSHDLRAPLRAMDGFAQALLEDYGAALDETGRSHANRIRAPPSRWRGCSTISSRSLVSAARSCA